MLMFFLSPYFASESFGSDIYIAVQFCKQFLHLWKNVIKESERLEFWVVSMF